MSAVAPPGTGELTKEQLLEAYRVMRTIREFEERLHREFATGRDPRLRAPVRRRGGDRGRRDRPPRARRLRRQHAPRPRPRDRQGLRRQGR